MKLIANNHVVSVSALTINPTSESPLFPTTNLKNILRSKRYRSTSKTNQGIVFDFGSAVAVDAFVMLLPKEGVLNMTGGATITLQGNSSNSWGSPPVNENLTLNVDERQVSFFLPSTETYRYWRVYIDDTSAVGDYVEISKIILGPAVSIPLPQNGFKIGKTNNTKLSKNDFGSVYADKYPVLKKLSLDWKTLLISEIEQLDDVYDSNGNHTPVYITLDEESMLFNKDTYSIYGLLDDKFDKDHVSYNILDSSGFDITELN